MNTTSPWAPWRRRLSTWHRPTPLMLSAGPHAPAQPAVVDAAVSAFSDWALAHAGSVVDLGLSSHFMLMGADPDAPSAEALRASLAERWSHYLDIQPSELEQGWCVQTTLDLGPAPVAVGCALPRELVEGLQGVAHRQRLRLRSVQPWWWTGLLAAWLDLPRLRTDGEGDAARHWAWREGGWQAQVSAEAQGRAWRLGRLTWGVGDVDAGFTVRQESPGGDRMLAAGEVSLLDLAAVRRGPGRSGGLT